MSGREIGGFPFVLLFNLAWLDMRFEEEEKKRVGRFGARWRCGNWKWKGLCIYLFRFSIVSISDGMGCTFRYTSNT